MILYISPIASKSLHHFLPKTMTGTSPPIARSRAAKRIALPIVNALLKAAHLELPPYMSVRERISFLAFGCDRPIKLLAQRLLSPGDVAVDVGAHVGLVAKPLARIVGPKGRVYAFEPDPSLCKLLTRNTRSQPQTRVNQVAISERTQTATFYLHPTSGMSNSLVNAWEGNSAVTVQCYSLDDWLALESIHKVTLVKIDVEGAEPLVLRGMKGIMQSPHKPHIISEFCPGNLGSREAENEVFELLLRHAYKVYKITSRGGIEQVSAPRDLYGNMNDRGYANIFAQA